MIEKVSELKTEPIVGKYYLVECVRWKGKEWRPLIGPSHTDPEIGIHARHRHYDLRFMSLRLPTQRPLFGLQPEQRALGNIYYEQLEPVVLRKMMCKRRMPDFPYADGTGHRIRIVHLVELKFVGRKVLCGKCPHKGMPLESLPQDKDGNVICNGHGLKINLKKEVVVERAVASSKE